MVSPPSGLRRLPLKLRLNEKKVIRALEKLYIVRSQNLSFIDLEGIKVACVRFEIGRYEDLEGFVEHAAKTVGEAAAGGAHLVCLPELIGLIPVMFTPVYQRLEQKLSSLPPGESAKALLELANDYCEYFEEIYFTLFSELAGQYGVYIQAGTLYYREGDNLYNRAFLFDPEGNIVGYQNKLHLSRFEAMYGVTAGSKARIINTKIGRLFIAIGQDNLFFECYRIAKGRGAQLAIAPVCDISQGCSLPNFADVFLRVQENSLFAAKSALNGKLLGLEFSGCAGIYCPTGISPDKSGILDSSTEGMNIAEARVNISRLPEAFDGLSVDKNRDFHLSFCRKHYRT